MAGPTAALAALRDFILAQRAAAAVAPEVKMLQGVYRGFAGEGSSPVIHYHGGTYPPGAMTERPLYMSRDKAMAQSYADIKGGRVVALAPRPRKTATSRELKKLAAKYVPENAANYYTPATALDVEMHGETSVGDLINELWNREYDSARAFDVGMDAGRGGTEGEVLVALPGENIQAAPTERIFVSPQKRIADYYAQKRAAQTGEAPHAEMLLVDPFGGETYGHSTMGTGREPPMFTNARKIKPEDVVESTQLYRRGGAVHMGIGGLLKLKNAVKGAQKVLPAAERDANLAKFLDTSQEKRRLYHATPSDFQEFQGKGFDPTISGNATWLTSNKDKQPAAHNIGSRTQVYREGVNVMPVHVQAERPLVLDNQTMEDWARAVYADDSPQFPFLIAPDTIKKMKEDGYDSIFHPRSGEVIMLDPKKIKSATGNRGTYDITDPDISKARGGAVHMDEGGAAFGVFPQMKPRRAQQDREAAANAPLSALRGYAAGTAGLPGDIEGLARAGISQLPPQVLAAFPALRAFGIGSRADPTPQLPTTEFYNEYLPGAQLNATPTGKAFTTAGNLFGGAGSTTLARYGIKSAKATAKAIAEAAPGPASGSRAAQLGVIKMPGGNFLKGEVEDSVSPIKDRQTSSLATSQEEADYLIEKGFVRDKSGGDGYYVRPTPINTFIDNKIAPYIRNEMATPNDPLRAMAEKYAVDKPVKLAEVQGRIDAFAAKMEQTARERGVPVEQLTSMRQQMIGLEKEKALVEAREGLHFTPDDTNYFTNRDLHHTKAGTDVKEMGQSPLARSWEDVSDSAFGIETAGNILRFKDSFAPWLSKVPPETKVYRPKSNIIERTGFDHLVDELRNATNPASGLPKNLLIDPADLGKLTMPQAVDRVADINAWRATQKAEANQLLANNAATQLVKKYPGQGVKWVELKVPKDKPLVEGEYDDYLSQLPQAVQDDISNKAHEFVRRTNRGIDDGSDDYMYAVQDKTIDLMNEYAKANPRKVSKELEDALKYEGDTMQHCVGGYCPDVAEGRSRIYSLRDDKGQPRVTIEVEPLSLTKQLNELTVPEFNQLEKLVKRAPETQPHPQRSVYDLAVTQPDPVKAALLQVRPDLVNKEKITQIKGFRNKKPADEYLPFVQDFVKSGNWSEVNDLKNAGLHDARAAGKPIEGRPAFMTDEELAAFKAEFAPKPEGMAHGGLVSTHFDPIKIQQIIARMDDDFDPERIQQIVAQRESAYA